MKKVGFWSIVVASAACGALHAGDKTISGNYAVAAGGETYDNVTVTATATISGGTLAVADGGTITVSAGTASFTCPITMGTTSAGKVTIAPAAGATADFTGKISGPADIDIVAAANSGVVKFTSSTSDYDGNLLLTQGTFHAKGDAAFGSTSGTSTFIDLAASGACVYFDGFTTSEHIVLSQSSLSGGDGYGKERVYFTANCTFNGDVTDGSHKGTEWGWNFSNGITVNFNGSFTGFGQLMGAKASSCTATINFNCSPEHNDIWYWQGCTLNLYARRSFTGSGTVALRGGTYNFHVPNFFVRASDNTAVKMQYETAAAAMFNLIDGEQTFSYMDKSNNSAASTITSASGQTFRLVNTAANSSFAGRFRGNVNVSLAGNKTLTLSGVNDTTGTLVLSNSAQVVLASGGDWCGKLAFQSADGSQLMTLNGDISVSGLRVAGIDLPDGVYGSSSSSAPAANRLSCFAGSGMVTVAHDLVIDTAAYVVPSGGETCQSVTVLANATITGGKLTVLGGNVSVAAGKTARFENEVSFGADGGAGTVAIAPAAGATATFTGKLTGPNDIEIFAADHTGVVRFAPASGVTSDFDGNLTVTRGEFHAVGDSSLGSTAGYTYFVNTLTGGVIDNRIYFDGLTTSETLYLSRGTVAWSDTYRKAIYFTADCTFNGPILAPSAASEFGWDFANNITINFNGGLGTESAPFGALTGNDGGTTGTTFNFNSSPYVKSNWYWLYGINNMNCQVLGAYDPCFRGGTYHLNRANVFATASGGLKRMHFETAYAMTFDLVQGVQTFTHISEKVSGYSRACVITSSTGQTFELRNTSDSVFRGQFSGDVNLNVLGDRTVSLYGQSDTTGTLVLSNSAKVVFESGARWTGKLAFQDDTGSQTVTLNNGGMTVRELWVDGVRLPNGDYGSSTSGVPAANQKAFLAGSGVLTVGDSYGVLVVNGSSYSVAAGGETYSGVIVSNNATITGGKLTVLDGGTIMTAAGKTATFAGEVAFGTQGSYPIALAPEAGATNRYTGKLTGPADVEIRAADQTGVVYFAPAAGVTDDFDGNLTVVRGAFHAAGDSALGSTSGYTYFVNTRTGGVNDNRIFFDGLTTSETIYLSRGSVGWSTDYTIRFTADCTFNGPILSPSPCAEYGWFFADGITLNFNGGLGSAEKPYNGLMGSESGTCAATLVFNSSPYATVNWYWKNGTNEMNAPLLGNCSLRFRGGYYHLNLANAFVDLSGNSKPIIFENNVPLTFNLVTGSQKFSYFSENNSSCAEFTSATAQDVHLDASFGVRTFHGRFTGDVNLYVDAAQTLVLSAANTSTGTLALTNGAKVVFTPTGSWAGRIALAGDGGEKLFVSNTVSVTQLEVGGQPLAPGCYGPDAPVAANRLSCLEGNGFLIVGQQTVSDGVWNAGAGSDAPGIGLGANWASGAEPDGSSGLASVTFAAAGVAAEVTHDVFWKTMTFSQDVPFFRVAGSHAVTLGSGVTVESDESASLAYEVATPLATVGSQTWTVPSNATLTVSGDLSGPAGTTITCNGSGTYAFSGANSDTDADFTFAGSARVYPKSSKAFGSAAGATTLNVGNGALILDNFTTDEPFVLRSPTGAGMVHITQRPGTNVLNGRVSAKAAVYLQGQHNGDRLVFAGGLDFDTLGDNAYFQISWCGNRLDATPFQIEVTDVPITNSGSHSVRLYNECVCDVIFSVASNRLTGTGGQSIVQMTRNEVNAAGEPVSRLFCKVPWAFAYSDTLLLGYATNPGNGKPYCGLIDLCGNDQGFASAYGHGASYQSYEINGKPQGAYSVVKSTGGPALLCSRHTGDASTWWTFTDAAGYRMEGTGGITFRTSSESTGALCVTNGTMTIPAGVTWRNCSRVVASDNGTFCLAESRAFGPGTEVRLSGNGKMDIAAGVTATAGALYLDGDEKALLGEWGSTESGAAHTSAHFTGTGKIRFGSQFIIIFR